MYPVSAKTLCSAATKGLSFELRRPRYCHKAEIVKRSDHAKVADGQNAIQSIGPVRLQTDRDPELLFASSSTSNKFIFLTPTGGELVRLQIGFPSGTGIAGPMFPVSDISTIRSSVRSGVLEHSGGGITPCKQDQRTLLGFGVEQDDFSSNLHLALIPLSHVRTPNRFPLLARSALRYLLRCKTA